MDIKRMVQVTVFNNSRHAGDGWPPEDPAGFMAWFAAKIAEIPSEYRKAARIALGSQSEYYGDHTANIEITYQRPETDEQQVSRLAREASALRAREEQERQTLALLQRKYGTTPPQPKG